MNSQNFSVNSHLLKFVSLCNDLRTNLLSNHVASAQTSFGVRSSRNDWGEVNA